MSPARSRTLLAALALSLASALSAAGAPWRSGDAVDRILVLWRPQPSAAQVDAELRRLGLSGPKAEPRGALRSRAGAQLAHRTPVLDLEILSLPGATGGADVDRALAEFRASGLVQAAEADHPVRAAAAAWPNDPAFSAGLQRNLTNTAWTQAYASWQAGAITLANAVTVAVLDTGVDAHSDMAAQLVAGASFIPGEPSTDDRNGHGTFVAGLIAATPANASGIAGAFMDPALLRLMPVKVLDGCGNGSFSSLASGLLYAIDQGVRIVNMSIESDADSEILAEAALEAQRRDVVLVAAAGNHASAAGWPAAYASVISVGALDLSDAPASYTNFGKVDLSAPGGGGGGGCSCQASPAGCASEIWSLSGTFTGCTSSAASFGSCGTANYYTAAAGTSFAAPMVAAAAAMILSQSPGLSSPAVLQRLLQGVDPTSEGPGYHSRSGWGKLNFKRALLASASAGPGADLKAWNWPNPFSPAKDGLTTFSIQLPAPQDLKVRLLDAGGDLVKQWDLPAATTWAGLNFVQWDGRNGAGREAANGSYLMVVESGGQRRTHRVALLR